MKIFARFLVGIWLTVTGGLVVGAVILASSLAVYGLWELGRFLIG